MDASPELEFDFFLADRLGLTVAGMREQVSSAEYVGWTVYFGRQAQRRQIGG